MPVEVHFRPSPTTDCCNASTPTGLLPRTTATLTYRMTYVVWAGRRHKANIMVLARQREDNFSPRPSCPEPWQLPCCEGARRRAHCLDMPHRRPPCARHAWESPASAPKQRHILPHARGPCESWHASGLPRGWGCNRQERKKGGGPGTPTKPKAAKAKAKGGASPKSTPTKGRQLQLKLPFTSPLRPAQPAGGSGASPGTPPPAGQQPATGDVPGTGPGAPPCPGCTPEENPGPSSVPSPPAGPGPATLPPRPASAAADGQDGPPLETPPPAGPHPAGEGLGTGVADPGGEGHGQGEPPAHVGEGGKDPPARKAAGRDKAPKGGGNLPSKRHRGDTGSPGSDPEALIWDGGAAAGYHGRARQVPEQPKEEAVSWLAATAVLGMAGTSDDCLLQTCWQGQWPRRAKLPSDNWWQAWRFAAPEQA